MPCGTVRARFRRVLATLLRWYLKSGLRGSTRCTFAAAQRFKTLHAVPIVVNERQRLWIDLRDGLSHPLLAGSLDRKSVV